MTAWKLGAVFALLFSISAQAWDQGQWENQDPAVREWFQNLRQPDDPSRSCCGYGDAYWADDSKVMPDGRVFAIITDTRGDTYVLPDGQTVRRLHVPVGTQIEVPRHKYKYDRGNPTGHTVIFLNGSREVLCFVDGNGT